MTLLILKKRKEATIMNLKNNWLSITVISIILVIFLMIVFANANEGLDKYKQNELEAKHQQYLSKRASQYEYKQKENTHRHIDFNYAYIDTLFYDYQKR